MKKALITLLLVVAMSFTGCECYTHTTTVYHAPVAPVVPYYGGSHTTIITPSYGGHTTIVHGGSSTTIIHH